MNYVVDTNVAIVANGANTNASTECRMATIDFLEEMIFKGRLYLDDIGEIEEEYSRHLNGGAPGVGNRFVQAFFSSAAHRVVRVALAKKKGEFVDFPSAAVLKRFDRSDRKFAAVARKAGVPVANAVDSDWLEHESALTSNGIAVHFVCGKDRSAWYRAKT